MYECQLDPEVHGNEQYCQFGFFWDKLDKVVCLGCNDPRLFNDESNPHIAKLLQPRDKPSMVKLYNDSKYYVDEMDKALSQYTCVRPYRNGRTIRRFLGNAWDFCLNNAYVLFREHYSQERFSDTKYGKLLKTRTLRSNFYYELLFDMIGYKSTVPALNPLDLNCGPTPQQHDCEFSNPPHAKRVRSRFTCVKCKKIVCKNHSVPICHDCYLGGVDHD